jgi:hypothetical protein
VANAVERLGKTNEMTVDKAVVEWLGSCEELLVNDVDKSR